MSLRAHHHSKRVFLLPCFLLSFWFVGNIWGQVDPQAPKAIYNSEPSTSVRLSPEQTIQESRLPEGFRLQAAAKAPDVQQPIAMSWDDKGRLWIVENYTFAEANIRFDKELRDRVLIFEDTDSDGVFDRRKVFWDKGSQLTSIQWSPNGVWLLGPPNLLFLADADHDDLPDGEPIIHLNGFNDNGVHHNIANGLRWGPDGWLYGRHGILADSLVGVPGSDQRKRINCSIWRYSPDTKEFDVIAQGTTNPWGMDWDEHGHLFFINTVIGHLWHAIPGSHLERMYGEDLDPTVFELMPMIADHWHFDRGNEDWRALRTAPASQATDQLGGGHAHSGCLIYQGQQFPESLRGRLMTINFHGRRINVERLERGKAGFVGKHEADFVFFADPWFRGIELSEGPDGSVFVLDWSDTGECHEADGVHRTSGTIYRISFANKSGSQVIRETTKAKTSMSGLTTNELLAACLDSDTWSSRMARLLLSQRLTSNEQVTLETKDMAKSFLARQLRTSSDMREKLQSFWTLRTCGLIDEPLIDEALKTPEESIRIAGLLALADQPNSSRERFSHQLVAIAKRESSGVVLSYLAGLLPRLEQRKLVSSELLDAMVGRVDFLDSDTYPYLLWYGLKDSTFFDQVLWQRSYAQNAKPSKLARFASRKAALEIQRHPGRLERLFLLAKDNKDLQIDFVQGASEGLVGRKRVDPPPSWATLRQNFVSGLAGEEVMQAMLRLDQVFGSGLSLAELQHVVENPRASSLARATALIGLSDLEGGGATAKKLASDYLDSKEIGEVATTVFAKLADLDAIRSRLEMTRDPKYQVSNRQQLIGGLASRRDRMEWLIHFVEQGIVDKNEVSADIRRHLFMVDASELRNRLTSLWPEEEALETALQTKLQSVEALIRNQEMAPPDLASGKSIWDRSCASCHKLFGAGGSIGPDITGGQRNNLRYLTENILAPSASVAQNYRVTLFELEDGSLITGVILNQTDDTFYVQTTRERIAILKSEVIRQRPSSKSLMPEGLLDHLTEKEVRDLFGYLRKE